MAIAAGSKLRTSDLAGLDPRGTYSMYTGTCTANTGAWAVVVPTLVEGSGTGLTLSSNLFTLATGIWQINACIIWSTANPVDLAMFNTVGTGGTGEYMGGTFTSLLSTARCAVSTTIKSTGSAAVCFQCVATTGAAVTASRFTFERTSTST